MKDSTGWNLVWTSDYIHQLVDRIALNCKIMYPSQEHPSRMIAAAHGQSIHLWSLLNDGAREIGLFYCFVDLSVNRLMNKVKYIITERDLDALPQRPVITLITYMLIMQVSVVSCFR